MSAPKDDLDKFRCAHDTALEWQLRKLFLETYWGQFNVDRLTALACCYVNFKCYGCRYGAEVMEILARVSDDKVPKRIDRLPKQIFVPSSSNPKPVKQEISKVVQTTPGPAKNQPVPSSIFDSPPEPEVSNTTPAFSTDIAKSDGIVPERCTEISPLLQRFYTLSLEVQAWIGKADNPNQAIYHGTDKLRMNIVASMSKQAARNAYMCEIRIDHVTVAVGNGYSKKEAKHDACTKAVELLMKDRLKIASMGDSKKSVLFSPEQDDEEDQYSQGNRKRKSGESQLRSSEKYLKMDDRIFEGFAKFMILEPFVKTESVNAMSILNQSCDFNKAKYEVFFTDEHAATTCTIRVNGFVLASETGDTKQTLKAEAAKNALDMLRQICWTIQLKQVADADDSDIDRNAFVGEQGDLANVGSNKVGSDNVGHKLLKKMGWTGGGLGKEGNKGIEEPILADNVIKREGLGLQAEAGIPKGFVHTVRQSIQRYLRSDNQNDLVFSVEFRKEERAIIHREAQKLGLKTHSHGSGMQRSLVLSRKRGPDELFKHVQLSGGETSKYRLLPPVGIP